MGKTNYVFQGALQSFKSHALVDGEEYILAWSRGSNNGRSDSVVAARGGECDFSQPTITFNTNIEADKGSWKPKMLTLSICAHRHQKAKELGTLKIDITKFLQVSGDGHCFANQTGFTDNIRFAGVQATFKLAYIMYRSGETPPTPNFLTLQHGAPARTSHAPSASSAAPTAALAAPATQAQGSAGSSRELENLRRQVEEDQTQFTIQLSQLQSELEEARRLGGAGGAGGGDGSAELQAALLRNSETEKKLAQAQADMVAKDETLQKLFAELQATDASLRAMREERDATRKELAAAKAALGGASVSPPQQKWAEDFADNLENTGKATSWEADFGTEESPIDAGPATQSAFPAPPVARDQPASLQSADAELFGAPEGFPATPAGGDAHQYSSEGSPMSHCAPYSTPAPASQLPALAASPRTSMPTSPPPSSDEGLYSEATLERQWLQWCADEVPVFIDDDVIRLALTGMHFDTPLCNDEYFALGEIAIQVTVKGTDAIRDIASRIVQVCIL